MAPLQHCSKRSARLAGIVLLLASLAFLAGCQGVSAGGSSTQQIGTLSLASTGLNFGSVAAGSSKTLSFNATNSGNASLTVSVATISASQFSLTSTGLPLTIAAGQSAPMSIKFSPTAAGTFNATLSITSNASNSAMQLPLSGVGTSSTQTQGQLSVSPTSEAFGNVTIGNQSAETVTLTNTGGSSVDISQASVSGAGFTLSGITAPLTLNASQSTTFTVTFAPTTAGAASGTVTITSDGSNPTLTMSLSGTAVTPGTLASNPTSLSFGSVTVGKDLALTETITNTGGTSVSISNVAISGTGYTLSGITTPVTLNAGQDTTFTVTFTPTTTGSVSGTVTISSTASNPTLTVGLSGSGTAAVGTLAISPTTMALGSVVVGTSGTGSGTLTASGASVTVTAATTNNSVFSVSGLSLPVTIPAGQSVPFTITFSPTTTGAASGTLSVTSNAQTTTTTEALTGTGTAAPTYQVSLSWTASTSSDISGYNIYRAVYTTACGAFSKVNPSLNATTQYTDTVVVDGTNYCYATTAVNTSNEESGYSNIVSDVQIPAP